MLVMHPLLQFIALIIALYVFKLGLSRFSSVHLRKKRPFDWKNHVRFGLVANIIWIVGFFGGLYAVYSGWNGIFLTGLHAKIALILVPFIVFAIVSGVCMDKRKKKRRVLPLVHAGLNTVMLLLVLVQVFTGIQVFRVFVWGS
ncbi:MAG: DUF4079 family protein [Thermodesulfobacteriota bacterium]